MKEILDNFFSRIYADFTKKIALIYPVKIGIGKPKKWSFEQVTQYLNYLKQEEVMI